MLVRLGATSASFVQYFTRQKLSKEQNSVTPQFIVCCFSNHDYKQTCIDIFSTKVHILFLEEELEFISVLVKIIVMPETHEESVMI